MKYCELCKRVPPESRREDLKCFFNTYRITDKSTLQAKTENWAKCPRFKEALEKMKRWCHE